MLLFYLLQLHVFDERNTPRYTLTIYRTDWNIAQFPSHVWICCVAPDSYIPSTIRIATFVPSCDDTSVRIHGITVKRMTVRRIRCPSLARSAVHSRVDITSVQLSSNCFSACWAKANIRTVRKIPWPMTRQRFLMTYTGNTSPPVAGIRHQKTVGWIYPVNLNTRDLIKIHFALVLHSKVWKLLLLSLLLLLLFLYPR